LQNIPANLAATATVFARSIMLNLCIPHYSKNCSKIGSKSKAGIKVRDITFVFFKEPMKKVVPQKQRIPQKC